MRLDLIRPFLTVPVNDKVGEGLDIVLQRPNLPRQFVEEGADERQGDEDEYEQTPVHGSKLNVVVAARNSV